MNPCLKIFLERDEEPPNALSGTITPLCGSATLAGLLSLFLFSTIGRGKMLFDFEIPIACEISRLLGPKLFDNIRGVGFAFCRRVRIGGGYFLRRQVIIVWISWKKSTFMVPPTIDLFPSSSSWTPWGAACLVSLLRTGTFLWWDPFVSGRLQAVPLLCLPNIVQ